MWLLMGWSGLRSVVELTRSGQRVPMLRAQVVHVRVRRRDASVSIFALGLNDWRGRHNLPQQAEVVLELIEHLLPPGTAGLPQMPRAPLLPQLCVPTAANPPSP